MKITITTLADYIFSLDVSEDLELENFKAFCEVESGFPANEIILVFNGLPLIDDKKSLKDHGIRDNDCVVLQHMESALRQPQQQQQQRAGLLFFFIFIQTKKIFFKKKILFFSGLSGMDFSSIQIPGGNVGGGGGVGGYPIQSQSFSSPSNTSGGLRAPISVTTADDPAEVRKLFLAHPDQMALLKQNNPELADALLSGDLDSFSSVLGKQIALRNEKQHQKLRLMAAGPFDSEAQRLIADEIRQKNIDANMEAAMEYNPETFGTVVMLYIDCKVNNVPVKAFVDSGAQTTIMSSTCAERCHLMRLLDSRWSGIAKGVGVQKIVGRIHMVQIQIENDYLTTSFSVLEQQPMDVLLGLDMLKRHQCNIDLQSNVLRIGTTGTETRFLSENELPECARLSGGSPEEEMKAIEESSKQVEEMDMKEAMERSRREQG